MAACGCDRTSLLRVALVCVCAASARAYDLGQDVTLCWVTPVNQTDAQREDCAGANLAFETTLPSDMEEGQTYSASYSMTVPSARCPSDSVPHANVHSCRRTVGFCTPFVSNTPGLATHTASRSGTLKVDSNSDHTASFESQVKLDAGGYTMIAHGRWFDCRGAKHDMARAVFRDVQAPVPITVFISIGLGSFIFIVASVAAVYFVRTHTRRVRTLERKAVAAFQSQVARVHHACATADQLAFPMCCVTYAHFKSHGKIISYEEARQAHELIVFDQSVDVNEALGDGRQRIAFVSHQWKGVRLPFPDPTGSDFDAITVGLEALIASKGLDPATLLVWLDYTSIPQRNRALQTLSIASLPAYVSLSTYFLISAPPTTNPQTGVLYDLAAWKSRGWCRLEQWARITQCGVEDMYLIDGGAPVSVSEDFELLANCMRIFEGHFSVEKDKAALVDTSIALFHLLLAKDTRGELRGLGKRLLECAMESKETIFPTAIFDELILITESITKEGSVERLDVSRRKSQAEQAAATTTSSTLTQHILGRRKCHRIMIATESKETMFAGGGGVRVAPFSAEGGAATA